MAVMAWIWLACTFCASFRFKLKQAMVESTDASGTNQQSFWRHGTKTDANPLAQWNWGLWRSTGPMILHHPPVPGHVNSFFSRLTSRQKRFEVQVANLFKQDLDKKQPSSEHGYDCFSTLWFKGIYCVMVCFNQPRLKVCPGLAHPAD